MVSTFSFPTNVEKGSRAAAYTCPGTNNAGTGVPAPVPYGQCDGGICFKSTTGQRFPGFDRRLEEDEIICSCPISTGGTGSEDAFGYQIFGPYHPRAIEGKKCDASACAACSVPNPTANGSTFLWARQPVLRVFSRRSWMGRFRSSTSACVNVPRRMATPPVRRQTDHDPAMIVTKRVVGEEMTKMGDVMRLVSAMVPAGFGFRNSLHPETL